MTPFESIQTIASVATAVGVAIAAWQLSVTKQQAQSQFEDSFTEQYRRIVAQLPLAALLGQALADAELKSCLRAFYEYFDLSNEQAFLAARGRLRPETWENWREGIEQHLARPAFTQAWQTLAPHLDGSFDALRLLLPTALRSEATRGRRVGGGSRDSSR
jgi:hypothetical protein